MATESPVIGAYELRKLTRFQLKTIETQWREVSGAEEFEVELGAIFERYHAEVANGGGDGYSMELFNGTTGMSDAILEMVSGKRGAVTKLLTLRLGPHFWNSSQDIAGRKAVLDAYAGAYVHVIAQGIISSDVDEVKIYGRNDVMLDILTRLGDLWDSETLGWNANVAGRWLVISRSKTS